MLESLLEIALVLGMVLGAAGWVSFFALRSVWLWDRERSAAREAAARAAGREVLDLLEELYAELDSGRERLERAQALLTGKEV